MSAKSHEFDDAGNEVLSELQGNLAGLASAAKAAADAEHATRTTAPADRAEAESPPGS